MGSDARRQQLAAEVIDEEVSRRQLVMHVIVCFIGIRTCWETIIIRQLSSSIAQRHQRLVMLAWKLSLESAADAKDPANIRQNCFDQHHVSSPSFRCVHWRRGEQRRTYHLSKRDNCCLGGAPPRPRRTRHSLGKQPKPRRSQSGVLCCCLHTMANCSTETPPGGLRELPSPTASAGQLRPAQHASLFCARMRPAACFGSKRGACWLSVLTGGTIIMSTVSQPLFAMGWETKGAETLGISFSSFRFTGEKKDDRCASTLDIALPDHLAVRSLACV